MCVRDRGATTGISAEHEEPAAPSVRLLAAVVQRTDPEDRDLSQFVALSRTVWIKYRCIRHGMVWGAVFLLLTSLGLLTGASA